MKVLHFCLVCSSVLVQQSIAQTVDYTDLNDFCLKLQKIEQETIQMELAEGYLSKEEADYESSLILTTEQCTCYFNKILDVVGVDYTTQLQKYLLASDPLDETVALDEPELPDGVDEVKLSDGIATACGIK